MIIELQRWFNGCGQYRGMAGREQIMKETLLYLETKPLLVDVAPVQKTEKMMLLTGAKTAKWTPQRATLFAVR